MSTENTVFEDALVGRVDALKTLYAEFFLLMDINLEEHPELKADAPPTNDLDSTISGLMDDIQKRMGELHDYLGRQKDWRNQCSPETLKNVDDFQLQLASGLEAVLSRVEQRGGELEKARDEAKSALTGLIGKNKSKVAYQGPVNAPSTLFDSKA